MVHTAKLILLEGQKKKRSPIEAHGKEFSEELFLRSEITVVFVLSL